MRDEFRGALVFERDVEVFDNVGHKLATCAFAWSEATTGTKRRFFAVLSVPPIDSPLRVVQTSIVSDSKALDAAKRALDWSGLP